MRLSAERQPIAMGDHIMHQQRSTDIEARGKRQAEGQTETKAIVEVMPTFAGRHTSKILISKMLQLGGANVPGEAR